MVFVHPQVQVFVCLQRRQQGPDFLVDNPGLRGEPLDMFTQGGLCMRCRQARRGGAWCARAIRMRRGGLPVGDVLAVRRGGDLPERTPSLGQRTELVLPARAGELLRLRLLVSVVEAFLEFEGSLRMELDLQANGIAPGVPARQLDVHALERGVGLHEAVVDPRLRQPRGIEYAQDAGISQHERLRGQHDAIAQRVAHPAAAACGV